MRRRFLTIIIAGFLIEILCVLIASIGDIRENIPRFSFLYTASFVVYIFSLFYMQKDVKAAERGKQGSNKKVFWAILIFSLLFRLTLLPMTPSDDLYRYLWEGRLQLHWINPYSHSPESSHLEHLRDNFYFGINHKHLPTIYPPFTLMVFALADYISHSFLSIKAVFLVFDVLLIFLLIRFLKAMGREPVHVLTYAWSPLILMSFAARGHCDSLQIFFVMLALYFYSVRKTIKSVVSLGLAVMSKFVFIILVPFLIPLRKPKYLGILFLLIVLFYVPYMSAGRGLFSTLFLYGKNYHFNDSIHFLFYCLTGGSTLLSKIIISIIFSMALCYFYLSLKPYARQNEYMIHSDSDLQSKSRFPNQDILYHGDETLRFAFLSIGTLLILAPTVHPWYLTWIVPFLCFYRSMAWLSLTGSVVFYYLMSHPLFSKLIEHNREWVWGEVNWLKFPEYLPFYGLLIYELLKRHRKGKILYPGTSRGK
ncbi:MAG: hypothetical protein MRK02_11520 [Candidatus Scalindua sp.]|nr:hypothetical protein [Candidatus Scalindua sp.]